MTDDLGDFWVYPLQWGDTLSNHDWIPLYINRLLTSRFVAYACAEGRREDIGTAVILWAESFKQDPAGTLPDDDVELAQLAKFGADIEGWKRARAGAMHGFRPCHVDGDGGHGAQRLGHLMIAEICQDLYRRKRGREASREDRNFAVQCSRVKKKMIELGNTRAAENPGAVRLVAKWIVDSGLPLTEDNVRRGMEAAIGAPRAVK